MNCNNCEDIYPDSDMTRWESCPSSIIADANNYYTKHQVDELIESASTCCITPEEVDEKISAATNGMATEQWVEDQHYITGVDLSDYATHQWVEDKHYLTEHQPLKTINNQVISGTGNIEITGSSVVVDPTLSSGSTNPVANSAITNALNDKLDVTAYTPTDLTNYYTKSETSGKTEIANALSNKQNQLTAGSGISIVNNVISATGGGGGIVDPTLSSGSSNPVANSAITEALNDKLDSSGYTQPIQSDWNQTNNGKLDYIKNKPTIPEVPTEISSFHNDVGYITTASTIFNNYATTANTYTKQEVDNKFACMTEQEYQNLPTKQNNILYLIHD